MSSSSSSSANTDTNAADNTAASMMPIRPADLDPELERKIQEVTKSLPPRCSRHLRNIAGINTDNAATICDYVKVLKTEVSSNDHYRRDTIDLLTRLARNCGDRNFKNLTQDDIIAFLDILRKPDDSDPLHKWIGSYNLFKIQLTRFFKWLYHPDIEADKRQKPHVVENIPSLKRKEKSIYKPSDLWTQQDDLLFLRDCPSKRDKCYHAVSRDLSARPHEILKLKVNDLKFKTIGTRQYAEVTVNGKTGTRSIPLINSLPYVKDYLTNGHPISGNPNSPFICGIGKSLGKHLSPRALHRVYTNYKNVVFPSLLD